MPGEFYIEGKKQQLDLTDIKNIATDIKNISTQLQDLLTQVQNIVTQVENVLTQVQNTVTQVENVLNQVENTVTQIQTSVTSVQNNVTTLVTKSEGLAPVTGDATANWNAAESDVVSIGAHDTRYKIHSLLLSIHNLVGNVITVRMYTAVNGTERKVYEQSFDAAADPPGLWVINGTLGIHEALRVTLQSNNAADDGKAVDYDYMLEAMA